MYTYIVCANVNRYRWVADYSSWMHSRLLVLRSRHRNQGRQNHPLRPELRSNRRRGCRTAVTWIPVICEILKKSVAATHTVTRTATQKRPWRRSL